MKKIYIKWGNYHVLNCRACFDKKRRGYKSEIKYWDDFFDKKSLAASKESGAD